MIIYIVVDIYRGGDFRMFFYMMILAIKKKDVSTTPPYGGRHSRNYLRLET
jgi:hypothetical protein